MVVGWRQKKRLMIVWRESHEVKWFIALDFRPSIQERFLLNLMTTYDCFCPEEQCYGPNAPNEMASYLICKYSKVTDSEVAVVTWYRNVCHLNTSTCEWVLNPTNVTMEDWMLVDEVHVYVNRFLKILALGQYVGDRCKDKYQERANGVFGYCPSLREDILRLDLNDFFPDYVNEEEERERENQRQAIEDDSTPFFSFEDEECAPREGRKSWLDLR